MAVVRGVVELDPTITWPRGGRFEADRGVRLNASITLPPVALARAELHDLRLLTRDRASLTDQERAVVAHLDREADAMAQWGLHFNEVCLTAKQLARIKFAAATGCWLLPQSFNKKRELTHEYGYLACRALRNVRGEPHTSAQAHRTMWTQMMLLVEAYDLTDTVLDHQCYSKNCCYPRHMLRETQGANSSSWSSQHEARRGQDAMWRRAGRQILSE